MVIVEDKEGNELSTEVIRLEILKPEPSYKYGPKFAAAGFVLGVAASISVGAFVVKNDIARFFVISSLRRFSQKTHGL